MKFWQRAGWLFCLGWMGWSLSLQAEPIVFESTDSPPYWSADLPQNGFGGAMLQVVSKVAQIDYALKYLPVKRFSLSNAPFIVGNPDLLTHLEHRAIYPIGLFHAAFFFYTPLHPKLEVHSLRDMKGHTLGVLRGSIDNMTDFVRHGIKVEESDSVESLIRKLKRGRIDFCILVAGSGRYVIQQLFPYEQDKFEQVLIPSITRPIALIIDLNAPGGKEIAARYQAILRPALQSAAYRAVVANFYGQSQIPSDRNQQLNTFIHFYQSTWIH